MNSASFRATVSGRSFLAQGCPAIIMVASLWLSLTSCERRPSNTLGLRSRVVGMFFSGTMKEVNPSATSCGDDFAASAIAPARRDATACASGLRGHASGTRGPGREGACLFLWTGCSLLDLLQGL